MKNRTAFISCSAYAVGIYSASCPDVVGKHLFPVVIKPSPSLENQMSPSAESENVRIERVDARSCGTPEWRDIDQYFLQKGFTIDKFIDEGGRLVNSADLHALSLQTNQLLNKLKGISPSHYPGLDQAVITIVLVLKSARAKAAVDPLPKHLAEVVFAANYFLKVCDLIPDNTPEIGLADDNALLKRVLARNQNELAKTVILYWF
ncbi:MAG TPA: hypothetical protein VNY04_08825 [Chthoniobacterales bacterium]|nr:hypothetical protein [Chthoniobacterales bacterium]